MSGSQFQFTPPFASPFGYRPSWLLGPQLTFDPPFPAYQPGWSVMGGNGQVYNLWPSGMGLQDLDLGNSLGAWSASLGANPTSQQLQLPNFVQSLSSDNWDTIYGIARAAGIATWTDVTGSKLNIATGKPAAIGRIDPSGLSVPHWPTDAVAGIGVPSPAFSLGRRFGFASSLDVHLYLYADKDALMHDQKYLLTGGGVGFESKFSDGARFKLQIAGGRDSAGGPAGFINLQIGPF